MIVAFVVLIVLITRPKGLFGTAEPDLVGWLLRPFGSRKQQRRFPTGKGIAMQTMMKRLAVAAVASLTASFALPALAQDINVAALYNVSSGGLTSAGRSPRCTASS